MEVEEEEEDEEEDDVREFASLETGAFVGVIRGSCEIRGVDTVNARCMDSNVDVARAAFAISLS